MRALRLILLGMVLALSGCVYPAYRTLQPSGEIRFVDEAGNKVNGVRLYIAAYESPYGDMAWYSVWQSSNDFDKIFVSGFHEWQLETMMIHGRIQYKWKYCTEKAGYEDYVRISGDHSGLADEVIVLRKGVMQPCVDNLDSGSSQH